MPASNLCLDDNRLAAVLEGALDADEAHRVHVHLADCATCRELVGGLAAMQEVSGEVPAIVGLRDRETRWLKGGTAVGRYVVRAPIGVGAMGVVYEAHDPELDRQVALKLVRFDAVDPPRREAAQVRLLKEARAVARVSHPNVVAVYDAGTYEDRVFVAMELVSGTTLTEWMRERPRSFREVLSVFVPAGRALAAAHAAGIVHRDFKPDNVLFGRDGQIKVVDFGLARASVAEAAPPPSRPAADALLLSSHATQTGAVLGTPAYMAPEQRVGQPADASADQYSYCVALFEALHGARPGDHRDASSSPPRRSVPAWLRSAVRTGLADDPKARHASVSALVGALERGARQTRRRIWLGVGIAALGVFGGVLVHHERAARADLPAMCIGAEAEVGTVWGRERRETVAKAFGDEAASALDRYARDWARARTDACAATKLRGIQSEAVMEQRMRCLDRLELELGMLTDRLQHPEPSILPEARRAVEDLPPLSSCSASRVQASGLAGPRGARDDDPAVLDRLTRAKTELRLANLDEATRLAEETRALASEKEAPRFEAEALLLLGRIAWTKAELPRAEAAFFDAFAKADEAGSAYHAAWAAAHLVGVDGQLRRFADSERWDRLATSAIRRAGGDPTLTAELASDRASALLAAGEFRRARDEAQRGVDGVDADESKSTLELMNALILLAATQAALGETEAARTSNERAASIATRLAGPEAAALPGLFTTARRLEEEGRYAEAIPFAEQALQAVERPDVTRPQRAWAHVLLAKAFAGMGRVDEARRELEPALRQSTGDATMDPFLAAIYAERGRLARVEKRYDVALGEYRTSTAIFRRALTEEDHPDAALALVGRGRVELERGRADLARPLLERAVRALGDEVPELDRAEARFALAQALLMTGVEPERARDLALEAQAAYARTPLRAAEVGEITAWFAKTHPTLLPP